MLKHRKQGGGTKRAFDNDIKTATAKAIEEKSVCTWKTPRISFIL